MQRAPTTLAALLDNPAYAAYLARQGNRQVVMVGYSDSTKDGGYVAATWGLYQAQNELHEIAAERQVDITFFHGRGGSLGRGGGPAGQLRNRPIRRVRRRASGPVRGSLAG